MGTASRLSASRGLRRQSATKSSKFPTGTSSTSRDQSDIRPLIIRAGTTQNSHNVSEPRPSAMLNSGMPTKTAIDPALNKIATNKTVQKMNERRPMPYGFVRAVFVIVLLCRCWFRLPDCSHAINHSKSITAACFLFCDCFDTPPQGPRVHAGCHRYDIFSIGGPPKIATSSCQTPSGMP